MKINLILALLFPGPARPDYLVVPPQSSSPNTTHTVSSILLSVSVAFSRILFDSLIQCNLIVYTIMQSPSWLGTQWLGGRGSKECCSNVDSYGAGNCRCARRMVWMRLRRAALLLKVLRSGSGRSMCKLGQGAKECHRQQNSSSHFNVVALRPQGNGVYF